MARTDASAADDDLATLVVLTGLVIADHVRDALAAHGWPNMRFSQLYLFAGLVEGPATIGALADRMGFTHQAGSQLAAELERAGLLRRIPNPEDARSRCVELTDEGLRALQVGVEARDELLDQLRLTVSRAEATTATRVVRRLFDLAGGPDAVRMRDLKLPRSM